MARVTTANAYRLLTVRRELRLMALGAEHYDPMAWRKAITALGGKVAAPPEILRRFERKLIGMGILPHRGVYCYAPDPEQEARVAAIPYEACPDPYQGCSANPSKRTHKKKDRSAGVPGVRGLGPRLPGAALCPVSD